MKFFPEAKINYLDRSLDLALHAHINEITDFPVTSCLHVGSPCGNVIYLPSSLPYTFLLYVVEF